MSTSIDERVSGLPTDLEDGKSGEMRQKAPCLSQAAIPKDSSESADEPMEDRSYRWTIEPHPYDRSYDTFVTDSDDVAREALLALWDGAVDYPRFSCEFDAAVASAHVLLTIETCPCDKQSDSYCNVCDGGLAICSICGKAEADLAAPCRITRDNKSALRGHNPEANQHSPASPPESRLKAEEVILRQAILDVIDAGWRCSSSCDLGHPYVFDSKDLPQGDEHSENLRRLDFADAVEKRIRELQSPPFNLGTKLENYCPRHIRERLPASTATVCADCMAEREEKK